MKRMINYYGPDSIDGGGAGPGNKKKLDPGFNRIRVVESVEEDEERSSWRDWLSVDGRKRLRTIEKVIAGLVTGSKIIKRIKGMKRGQKIAVGAVAVVGIAGATYLAVRSRRK